MPASAAVASPRRALETGIATTRAGPIPFPPVYSPDGLNEAILSRATIDILRAQFDAAAPFPHLVIDGLFAPEMLDRVELDYASMQREDWIKYENANEVKFGTRPNVRLGPGSQVYFDTIHRARFTQFLTAITGIEALVTDPVLRGGGLHEIPVGGKFKVQTDFTRHVDTRLDNRLVLITYLNKDWQDEWGGALELWTASECMRKVVPVFGRSILFMHSAASLHGHPDPVATPDGRTRRSAAAYFYINGRPDPMPPERIGTRFLGAVEPPVTARQRLGRKVSYFLPPVAIDCVKLAWRLSSSSAPGSSPRAPGR